MSNNRSAAYLRSTIVAVVLAVLTIVEVIIAINLGSAVLLMLIALFKAIAVLVYYMHVSRLWTQEEGH